VGAELQGHIQVRKLNIDENPRTADRYQVRSIPTLILFTGGSEQTRVVGAVPRSMIRREIDPHLPAATPAQASASAEA